MERARRLTIWILCTLMAFESAVFVNAGSQAGTSVSGADLPTEEPDISSNPIQPTTPGNPSDSSIALAKAKAEERGLLLLVNKTHPIDSSYKPDDLTSVLYYAENRSKETRYLRAEAASKFHELVEAASMEGYTLVMTTAYRSYGFQQILWNNYVAKEGEEAATRYSAKPGESEHQSGLAVDVTSPSVSYELTTEFGNTEEGIWLAKNAHQFGFILRYPAGKESITGYQYEPWHLRYVGEEVATYLYQEDLTLEEFLE